MTVLRVAVAQLPNRVGDLEGNFERIVEAMAWAEQEAQADVLVLPELVLACPLASKGRLLRRRWSRPVTRLKRTGT